VVEEVKTKIEDPAEACEASAD
jgi:hypothetical protein